MNSCLQCLSNLPSIVEYIQSGLYHKEINPSSPTKGMVMTTFGDVIQALWSSDASSIRPVEFKRMIGKVASRFIGYEQHDAQEFLRCLLDTLHEEVNRIWTKPPYYEIKDAVNVPDREVSNEYWSFYQQRNTSILSDLFCGQLRSEIICHTCRHRSLCFDVFWDLSLPIPKHKSNLSDCLRSYTEAEELIEEDAYYCCQCKTHRAVTKHISFYRLPSILVIHLKRFSYTSYSREKMNTAIHYPITGLDLKEYCALDAIIEGSTLYDLCGMVHHMGSLHGGHYTAYVIPDRIVETNVNVS